jgi:ankyrin repeat protein
MKFTKMNTTQMLMTTLFLLSSTLSFAGDKIGNGGDMCENRFKVVRDDVDAWIQNGGGRGLKLPKTTTLEQFNSSMLSEISKAKITCTTDKVMVRNAEKTCKNFVSARGESEILCNTARFMSTSESDQYVLVHHEYAGLAGLEVNTDESSVYLISNQVSGFLVNQVVKKLAIKPEMETKPKADTLCALPREKIAGLFQAILDPKKNAQDVQKYLNANPLRLDVQNEFCDTPIKSAVKANKIDVFEFLSRKMGNVDVNKSTPGSYTLYETALTNGNINTITYLEKLGGKLGEGLTPLMLASAHNSLSVVKEIYNRRPQDAKKRDHKNADAFAYAAGLNKIEVMNFILSTIYPDVDYTKALEYAVYYNNTFDVISTLVENGANIKGILSVAAKSSTVEVVRMLLDNGALVDGEYGAHGSPLGEAVTNNWEVSMALLEAGAQLEKTTIDNTPLMLALLHCSTIKQACANAINLIKSGANVNAISDNRLQESPLINAIHAPVEVIKELLKYGANKRYQNAAKKTAYDIAVEYKKDPEVLKLLKP